MHVRQILGISKDQIMDAATTNTVLKERECQLTWDQCFLFPIGKTKVKLSVTIRYNAIMPQATMNQPTLFPSGSRYKSDPSIYTGKGALEHLMSNLQSACPRDVHYPYCSNAKLGDTFFCCSHYYVQEDVKNFHPDFFTLAFSR